MEQLYAYSRAPLRSRLPVIMTHCTPRERRVIMARVQSKISKGNWNGARLNNKRGIIRISTQHSRFQQSLGVTILAYHAVLLMAGQYPTSAKSVCSHICHNALCVKLKHLQWSDSNDNWKREQCRMDGYCTCRLDTPCIFDCVLTGCRNK